MRILSCSLFILASLAVACNPSAEIDDLDVDLNQNEDVDPGLEEVEALDLPNAMGAGGFDLLPWPADQYISADEQGLRLMPDAALLPKAFTPRLLEASGASRVSPVVAWLQGGVSPESLPDPEDWGASLAAESAVRVVVLNDGQEPELWPVLAEIDRTARDPHRATLLIRPHRPFPAGARVAVGLRTTLKTYACSDTGDSDQECQNHEPSPALQRILAGEPEGRAEQSWMGAPRDALLEALPLLGPAVDDLAQAWTFTVREREEIVDPLLSMQRIAAEAATENFTLEPVRLEERRALVYGKMEVPWFLDEDNQLVLDDHGEAVVQEQRMVDFLVTIPRTIDAPRPVMLFGHGFFSAIEEPTWSNLFDGLERWEMAAVTTRFFGFAEADLPQAIEAIVGDTLEGMIGIIDLQRQSQANFTVLHNLVAHQLAGELVVDFGEGPFHPLDAESINYMGISNGGTQGLVMMSTSPVLTRGALVVPGGGWAHMLQRAAQWQSLGLAFSNRYNNDAELQVAMSMLQQVFDPVDSLNFVENLLHQRFEGLPENPEILIVEAVNDAQVANMVTRWVAGTAQVPLIVPSVAEVWGVPTTDAMAPDGAPGGVGYEIYDLGVPDNPPGNVAATENGVHNDVRLLDAYREQMGIFLEHGRVVRTCDGPCDPE